MNTPADLEKVIGYSFKDKALLEKALTHSSSGKKKNYERLEFLGDRVLGLIVAEELFQRFPGEPEGALARRLAALVQGSMLAKLAREINLGVYISFSDAEKAAGGPENDNILSDVFESLLGALYLDGGFAVCSELVHRHMDDRFDQMVSPPRHPKTVVQEWAQAKGLGLPVYEIVDQSGPDHAPEFVIRLSLPGSDPVEANGRSRQAAEKEAAKLFIKENDLL